MKKNINPIAIAAAIIAVIVIILVFVGMNRHKNDAGTQPDSSSVSESAASSEDNLASAETAKLIQQFLRIPTRTKKLSTMFLKKQRFRLTLGAATPMQML